MAAVRKESADTQEYESCHQNNMDVDRDEVKQELSVVRSASSASAEEAKPHTIFTSA